MGLDLLDIAFRIEKEFGIKWERRQFDRLEEQARQRSPDWTITAGDIHAQVCDRLRELGRPVPHSSWHRVKKVLAEASGSPLAEVKPESSLFRDLGLS